MLMSNDMPRGSLCTSNSVSLLIEELQFTLGEGPCIDAYALDHFVREPDLANPSLVRWFAFSPHALELGVSAIFGFPVRVGAARLGALNLYRDHPGPLTDAQHADGLAIADMIALWVISAQAAAPDGVMALELEAGSHFHFAVENAAGMISVQLGVSVTEAHVRLRAYAFSHNRTLAEVAEDVVTRKLRLS